MDTNSYLRIENGYDISKITGLFLRILEKDFSLISLVKHIQLWVAILKTKRD